MKKLLTAALTAAALVLPVAVSYAAPAAKAACASHSGDAARQPDSRQSSAMNQKDPAFALQLPLRVLVTEADGAVQVVFNDTRALVSGSKIEFAEVENTLANAEKLIRKTVTE